MRSIFRTYPTAPGGWQSRVVRVVSTVAIAGSAIIAAALPGPGPLATPLLAQDVGTAAAYDPDDWSDLKREAPYGSEKEEKYRINALVVEEEAWADHYSLGVLGLFRYTDYPAFRSLSVLPFYSSLAAKHDPRRSRWVFPAYYSSFDGREYLQITPLSLRSFDQHGNGFGLYGYIFKVSRDESESSYTLLPLATLSRDQARGRFALGLAPFFYANSQPDEFSLVAPLAYYSRNPDATASASPLHFYRNRRDAESETTTIIAPAFYRRSETDGLGGRSLQTLIGPIWHSSYSNADAAESEWLAFPFYNSVDSTTGESLRWYANFRYKSDADGEIESLWFAPLAFYRPGDDGYLHFAPLYFSGWRSRSFGEEIVTEKRSFGPLHYYSDRMERTGTNVQYRTTLWFPLPLPLHYRSDDSESGTARQYGPVYYEHDRAGALESLIAAPLFFYRTNDYLHVPPFYFQTHNDSEEYRSFSLLHYARVQKRDTAEESGVVLAGPYYRSYDQGSRRHYAHLVPLYFSWDTPESEFHLALPAFLRYESANRYIHVNAIGLSISEERLPIPRLARSDRNEWYLEQDVALFYNLFRLSTRVTLGGEDEPPATAERGLVPEANFASATQNTDEGERDRDRGVSRENSRYIWGVQSLYGMVAYEQADTRRHFRILPLSWFTWDQASDDRVYFVPGGFFSYVDESDAEEYFALIPGFLPLYGYQRRGESFIEAYAGLGYIREYDADSETREHSVLWPLANFYTSPRRSGGRVLPLFWSRNERDDSGAEESTIVSPLYYSHTRDSASLDPGVGPASSASVHISPLFYASSRAYRSAVAADSGRPMEFAASDGDRQAFDTFENTLILPLPGVYLNQSNDGSTYSWLGLAGLRFEKPDAADQPASRLAALWTAPLVFWGREPGGDAYLHLAPLYFSTRNHDGSSISRFGPGYYYSRDAAQSAAENRAESETVASTLILPGLYRSRDGSQTYTNLLLAGSWASDAEGLETVSLLPVFSYAPGRGDANRDSHLYAFLFYYGHDAYDRATSLHLLPAVFSWYEPARPGDAGDQNESGDFALFAAGLYIRRAPNYQRENFLYLIDRVRDERSLSLGLLFDSLSYEGETNDNRLALGYGYLAGISHRRYPEFETAHNEFEANLLWLTHESRPDYLHNSFFPLWWYDRDRERDSFLWAFAPLLSGSLREGPETTRLFGGGALYYEFSDAARGEFSRGVLLGALYKDEARRERGYRSRGSLWNYLWQYQSESESDFEKFSLLKFVYSRTRHEGRTRTRVLGIRVHES